MADLSKTTTLVNGDVFDPQVVSDMINAKVEKKAVMTGYITVTSVKQRSMQRESRSTRAKWHLLQHLMVSRKSVKVSA